MRSLSERLRFNKPRQVSLTNVRTGKVIADQLMGASTTWQHARGLMCRSLKRGQALVFFMPRRERFSLHMFMVFSSIDVLFCDHDGERFVVVDLERSFRPFTLTRARKAADCFIELPAGAARGVVIGDVLVASTPKDF